MYVAANKMLFINQINVTLDITKKQLIWYGHVDRKDPTRLPEIMVHWKPEGRKKRGRPRRTWKDGMYVYSHEWKRSKNG